MWKLYWLFLSFALFMIVMFGFVFPFLVSSKATELALLGVVLPWVVIPPVTAGFITMAIKEVKKIYNSKKEN